MSVLLQLHVKVEGRALIWCQEVSDQRRDFADTNDGSWYAGMCRNRHYDLVEGELLTIPLAAVVILCY